MTGTPWRYGWAFVCLILVGWIWQLPQHLAGADALADRVARFQVKARVARDGAADLDEKVEHWISENPQQFAKQREPLVQRFREQLSLQTSDGHTYPYLGDYDSYAWVRLARNYLEHGTTCDELRGESCRDTYVNAPLGMDMLYRRSFHIAAIVGLHRLISVFSRDYPLTSTASWVPWIGAILGVIAAFALGVRLGGTTGGAVAALLTFLHPYVVQRSLGSDNDIWNITLPLYLAWAIIAAFDGGSWLRRSSLFACVGLAAALQAITWSGWIFHAGILVLGALVFLLHELTLRRPENASDLRRSFGTFLLILLALAVAVLATSGVYQQGVTSIERYISSALLPPGEPPQVVGASGVWPSLFSTVSELMDSSFQQMASASFGAVWMWIALLGLPLAVLPRRAWWPWRFLVFAGSTGLATWAAYENLIGRGLLVLCLIALSVLAVVWRRGAAVSNEERPGCGEFVVAIWLVATVFLAFNGARYVELAAAPLALSSAIVVGRLVAAVVEWAAAHRWRWYRAAEPLLGAAVAVALLHPVSVGYRTAAAFIPGINDAWWKVMEYARDNSAPDAIVDAWWDYGYWVKYVARRPTAADGATLRSHLPYWIGRTLVSTHPLEGAGLLRMLNCKGDDTPYAEGEQSAYGLIQAQLNDAVRSQQLIVTVASQSRTEAAKTMEANGFTPEQQQVVLAATHCEPRDSYLLLSSEMARRDSWVRIGQWDFRKAFIRDALDRHVPVDAVVVDAAKRFALPESTIQSLVTDAQRLSKADFISGSSPRAPSTWYPCQAGSSAGTLRCPLGLQDKAKGRVIEEFLFSIAVPEVSRLKVRRSGDADAVMMKPGSLRLATATLGDVPLEGDLYDDTGVLVDYGAKRILVGSPAFLRSLYVQLVFLDGRYTHGLFEKVAEEISLSDDRVSLWRVHFPPSPAS